jgi:hypothetical protein
MCDMCDICDICDMCDICVIYVWYMLTTKRIDKSLFNQITRENDFQDSQTCK